ncbi:hypothetical protein CspeluHIS016_0901840 [Cutaneotrichosporon spelunceum]|uniref:Uncharacterized protein n=1 Tax=Cutaneotrichosporon spelunceum TaxID=1672016 RepID=A0AAD3U0S4_9TREE|nr:hypothetical protein CspeluHIS016_0901840 [Cutaneotrichosporon spelunceum]
MPSNGHSNGQSTARENPPGAPPPGRPLGPASPAYRLLLSADTYLTIVTHTLEEFREHNTPLTPPGAAMHPQEASDFARLLRSLEPTIVRLRNLFNSSTLDAVVEDALKNNYDPCAFLDVLAATVHNDMVLVDQYVMGHLEALLRYAREVAAWVGATHLQILFQEMHGPNGR